MRNILEHIQCGIFVLTVDLKADLDIKSNIKSNTDVLDIDNSPKDPQFRMSLEITNSAFLKLVFGEVDCERPTNLIGLQPDQCLPKEFVSLLNLHARECWRSQKCIDYEVQINLGRTKSGVDSDRKRDLLVSLSPNSDRHLQQIVGTCQDLANLGLFKSQIKYTNERNTNERKFGLLVGEVSDAVVVVDREGVVRYVNQAAERLFGYKSEDIVGEVFGLPVVSGESTDIDILGKGGKTTSAEMRVSEAIDEDRIVYVVASLRDISERKRVEESLLESEERLRTVLTSIKEGITFSDDKGNFAVFNSGMESLTGYTIDEANASEDFTTFLYPDSAEQQKALDRLQKLQETGQVITIETSICHKDGTLKDVLVSTRLMIYKGKWMYLSSYYDITERKKVETQLRYQSERERLLNSILLKIQCELDFDQILAITVKDAQELLHIDRVAIYQFQADWSGTFVVEAVKDQSLSILGRTINDPCFNQDYAQKYQNRRISSINDVDLAIMSPCHKELLQRFQIKANIVAAISFGDTLWGLLIAHECLSPRHWEEFEIDLFKQLANHVAIAIQQIKLFEKIQDLNKNLERQVADRTQQLEQSLMELERSLLKEKELNELKSQFISRASHEFRTPLSTIQAASDLLQNYGHKMSEEKKLERIHKIQREVKGMTNLLEEVLVIGKTESRKFELQIEETELEAFCLERIEQAKIIANESHQIIFKNINAPPNIMIDPRFLKQIISNLLSNAVKYSPQGGEINFKISQTDDHQPKLLLEISDQGIGIPQSDREKIFEHFYRAHNVGMIAGTGLGMAIIKNSIDILGGTIQIASIENKGTTIQVKLPIDN